MSDSGNLQSLTSSIAAVTSPFRNYLHDLHAKYCSLNEGVVADYIPELALAQPEWFGICVVTQDGHIFEVGDSDQEFTIQSISKAFVFGLALEDHGREYVNSKVSMEPTEEAFNSIVLDELTNRPYNPMVNAGAIATTDLIKGKNGTERLKRLLAMFQRYTGRKHDIDVPVFLSEKSTGFRNRAIAYLMLNFGMVNNNIDETLDLYFQQCSILVNAKDLAMMAATLANGGVNPVTKERAIDERYVQDVISVMLSCGMYDASGQWAYRVGLPAKSGVSGGITAIAPGKLGVGTFSPLLDKKVNSLRGIKVCEDLSREFGLHLFNVTTPERKLQEWIVGGDGFNDW
ncbi:glutaminase A [Nodularia sphaerocarpa]|uniref:glutaminase A n=1 Tax=Nodularia sphaerocarpa TaxID=137816 RepID=UPI001EFBBDAC|nr:glutaminase A [Nodularia sphaerocarpa]MDB9375654.1 glutaminase A [Nodularia sphaerocarpa CS-585]MDB9379852.1 glutaminase A [Nodularia sphaerocarpa CS-585A2]ULP70956.1 Glutaminase 1 [Nodularia sphaerocarpa UHCC 0038]